MDIGFATKALRSLSESETLACRKIGDAVANAFHAQLADLLAARNVEELPLGHIEVADEPSQFALPLVDGFIALFEVIGLDREAKPESDTNWRRVKRVKLLEVKKVNG